MAEITFKELPSIRERYKGKKIVFCSGVFDLTHAGHIIFFEDCKNLGDILVVSLGCDKLVAMRKPNRPILNEKIRIKTIDSLKPVDYCYIDPACDPDNTLSALDNAFENLHPDIYVINEDASDIPYRKNLCSRFKTQLVILERHCPPEFDNISTSKIIDKIKKVY